MKLQWGEINKKAIIRDKIQVKLNIHGEEVNRKIIIFGIWQDKNAVLREAIQLENQYLLQITDVETLKWNEISMGKSLIGRPSFLKPGKTKMLFYVKQIHIENPYLQ